MHGGINPKLILICKNHINTRQKPYNTQKAMQKNRIKYYREMYPDAIILYKNGIHYEAYGNDAQMLADLQNITADKTDNGDLICAVHCKDAENIASDLHTATDKQIIMVG